MIAPHLPPAKLLGRPRDTDLRAVVNAMLYLLTTGCQWRLLPKEFPPYTTVQRFFYGWRDDGTLAADQPPSAAGGARGGGARRQPVGGGDRQSVGQDHRGRRAARLRRRQEDQGPQAPYPDRHQGFLVAAPVHAADIQDRDGAVPLLVSIRTPYPGCATSSPMAAMPATSFRPRSLRTARGRWRSSSARMPRKGFELLPRRWVVERTLAWLNRNRRLAKDFEALDRNRRRLAHARQPQATHAQVGQRLINLWDIESGS